MANGFLLEEDKEVQKRLNRQTWWVEHRALLTKIGYGLFIAFDAALIAFVLWTALDSFALSGPRETLAVKQMAALGQDDLHAYTVANAAKDLSLDRVSILQSSEGKYDFYTTLTNPNDDWWADVTYLFRTSDGVETPAAQTFILPSDEKPLVAFGFASSAMPRGVTIELTDVVWHHVDHHLTETDYADWAADRLMLDISDVTLGTNELDSDIGRITFTVTNDSAYSYYQPVFYILLVRGTSVVGVNQTTIASLDSGQTEDMVVNWFGTLPSASKVEVIPQINIFDLETYKPLQGESSADTRTRVFPKRRR